MHVEAAHDPVTLAKNLRAAGSKAGLSVKPGNLPDGRDGEMRVLGDGETIAHTPVWGTVAPLPADLRAEISAPPKVIVMTADDTPETLLRAIRQQAYHYIAKPFDLDRMIETVKRAEASRNELEDEVEPEELPESQMIGSSRGMVFSNGPFTSSAVIV